MKINQRGKVQKKQSSKNNNSMIIGTPNHCTAANLSTSNTKGGGTDFSIAAIMARGSSSREPSERSLSKYICEFEAPTLNRYTTEEANLIF